MSRRHLGLVLCLVVAAATVAAQNKERDQNKEQERLAACGVVMSEVLNVPDNLPQEILDNASGQALVDVLQKRAPYNPSDKAGGR
jgi:hypothetical protein